MIRDPGEDVARQRHVKVERIVQDTSVYAALEVTDAPADGWGHRRVRLEIVGDGRQVVVPVMLLRAALSAVEERQLGAVES